MGVGGKTGETWHLSTEGAILSQLSFCTKFCILMKDIILEIRISFGSYFF